MTNKRLTKSEIAALAQLRKSLDSFTGDLKKAVDCDVKKNAMPGVGTQVPAPGKAPMAMAEKSSSKKGKIVLPGKAKIKTISAEGSGGKVTKGLQKGMAEDLKAVGNMQTQSKDAPVTKGPGMKATAAAAKPMQKDAMDVALGLGAKSPMKPAGLPGMTSGKASAPKSNAGIGEDTKASLGWMKDRGTKDFSSKATAPTVGVGQAKAFVKKPGADEFLASKDNSEISGDEKRAAGIGFLSNLISKFKGAGNKNWSDLRGAGSTSAGKVVRRMGARMALAETSPQAVQGELNSGKFKSLAAGAPNQAPKGGTPLTGFKSLVNKAEAAITKKGLVKDEKTPGMPKAPGAPAAAPKMQQTSPSGAPAGAGQSNAAPATATNKAPKAPKA